jgi:hypothetical protein
MATDPNEFKLIHTFTQGYIRNTVLREYLINVAGLNDTQFRIIVIKHASHILLTLLTFIQDRDSEKKVELRMKSEYPKFWEEHADGIQKAFNKDEDERKDKVLEEMAKNKKKG